MFCYVDDFRFITYLYRLDFERHTSPPETYGGVCRKLMLCNLGVTLIRTSFRVRETLKNKYLFYFIFLFSKYLLSIDEMILSKYRMTLEIKSHAGDRGDRVLRF